MRCISLGCVAPPLNSCTLPHYTLLSVFLHTIKVLSVLHEINSSSSFSHRWCISAELLDDKKAKRRERQRRIDSRYKNKKGRENNTMFYIWNPLDSVNSTCVPTQSCYNLETLEHGFNELFRRWKKR